MRIVIDCFAFKDQVKVRYSEEFARLNCPHCNSRHAFDVKVRKVGKSTKIKKAEQEIREKALRYAKDRYSTEANALVTSWDQLSRWDRDNRVNKEIRTIKATRSDIV
jgi:hypothetical protein